MRTPVRVAVAALLAFALALVAGCSGGGEEEPARTGQTPAGDTASGSPGAQGADAEGAELVRDDSPVLSEGQDAVLVEFLDFECEACIAVYPAMEQLRADYGDRVSFVVRHLPGHNNSMNAAKASEAAAEQGQFEAMYKRLFETDAEWGHQEEDLRDVFFGYAEELGLDMEQFEADFDDPEIQARIEQSQADGLALGATGTPTFFLDGEMIQPTSYENFEELLDEALAN